MRRFTSQSFCIYSSDFLFVCLFSLIFVLFSFLVPFNTVLLCLFLSLFDFCVFVCVCCFVQWGLNQLFCFKQRTCMGFPMKRDSRHGNVPGRDAERRGSKGREEGKLGCVQWRDGGRLLQKHACGMSSELIMCSSHNLVNKHHPEGECIHL